MAASNLSTAQFPKQMYPLPAQLPSDLRVASFIIYQRFRVQFSDKELSSIDMGNPAGSVCVCMRELTLPRRRIAAALIYISCGSCGLLKSKPREGGSLHPIENPAASSPLLFSLLSSNLISEYLISIMSDPSLYSYRVRKVQLAHVI